MKRKKKHASTILQMIGTIRLKTSVVLILAVLLVGAAVWLVSAIRQTKVSVAIDQRIDLTPEQITSIKAIGEWEFLSIADEELIDTVRKGIFIDDHLVRIYYGTIRLGINMHHVEPGWIEARGDTLDVLLPAIGLLDRDFIDEARTRSFYESGRWSHEDREALYQKAYRQMLDHCVTPEHLSIARQNGEAQFRRMMKVMGYQHVRIKWGDK